MRVIGVDFTSAPSKRKPITVAHGIAGKSTLHINRIESIENFAAFESLLHRPGPWIGGFDFPFGLPRSAVKKFKWPKDWEGMVEHCAKLGRSRFAEILNEDRKSRPMGDRYRYRSGDRLAGSSPAVRLHQVPVGFMFLEGAPRLAEAGLNIPVLRPNSEDRIALEAYPGYLTKSQLRVISYKSDEPKKQTQIKEMNRRAIVQNVRQGKPLGIHLRASPCILKSLVDDPMADRLDAVLCALQAAWGWKNRKFGFGLPENVDPVEGWILTVANK